MINALFQLVKKLIFNIEESPTNITKWAVSFTSIIVLRIFIEGWIGNLSDKSPIFIFYEFTHTFLFFIISFLLFLFLLNRLLKIDISKLSNIILWGFLIILTPPIVDNIISKGKGFWSFYKFDGILGLTKRFFTFFGDKPEIGITYGVRFEVAIVILLLAIYAFVKIKSEKNSSQDKFSLGKKNIIPIAYSAGITFLSYVLFFILGTFPSYITILIEGFDKGFLRVSEVDVAQMFMSPTSVFSREIVEITSVFNFKMSLIYVILFSFTILVGLFLYQKEKLISFLKNIRIPQIIYHIGLVSAGMGLGIITSSSSIKNYFDLFNIAGFFVLLESVILAWLASIVVNDIADKKIDEKTNNSRPLIQKSFSENEYKTIGILLFFFSLFFSSIVNPKFMLLLVCYQAIAWIYSSWPLRAKRFAFISTFVSAIASLIIFFGGFILLSPNQDLSRLPKSIIILLILAYTLSLPIKDFKDIKGDRDDDVHTIPVVFGEYWGKIIIGSGIFLSFLFSVLLINEFRLFWWAVIFGGISFWIVNKIKKDSRSLINYRNIFWWMLGVVAIYGIITITIVFFK